VAACCGVFFILPSLICLAIGAPCPLPCPSLAPLSPLFCTLPVSVLPQSCLYPASLLPLFCLYPAPRLHPLSPPLHLSCPSPTSVLYLTPPIFSAHPAPAHPAPAHPASVQGAPWFPRVQTRAAPSRPSPTSSARPPAQKKPKKAQKISFTAYSTECPGVLLTSARGQCGNAGVAVGIGTIPCLVADW
jgi:hypothetical protein